MTNNRIEIFKDFLNHQSNFIRGYHEKSPKKNNKTENYAVIVEPRSDHYLLEAVCRNIMYYLPDDWNLIVYSYDINIVREKLKNIDFLFYKTSKASFTAEEYSELLMSIQFWENIPGDNVLIFQTDSYITKRFTNEFIDTIKKYPFVGAVYRITEFKNNCDCCQGHVSCNINIISINKERNFSMSGGFSFRNKKAMIDCINKITMNDIIEYRMKNNLNISGPNINYEDAYFEDALFLLQYNLPSYELCLKFCLQVIYEFVNSHAVHGINKYYVYENVAFHLKPALMDLNDEIYNKTSLK